MKNAIITFNEDGTATCIHTDAIPLESIGTLQIRRASTIEFNELLQRWEVFWSGDDVVAFHHTSRAACLAWEVESLQSEMAGAACPLPEKRDPVHAFPRGRW